MCILKSFGTYLFASWPLARSYPSATNVQLLSAAGRGKILRYPSQLVTILSRAVTGRLLRKVNIHLPGHFGITFSVISGAGEERGRRRCHVVRMLARLQHDYKMQISARPKRHASQHITTNITHTNQSPSLCLAAKKNAVPFL